MRRLAILLLCTLTLCGCSDQNALGLRTMEVTLGDRVFTLEVADNDASRRKGLMDRRSMPEDHGMLFVFEYSDVLSFWMKNTYIPLDIIYLDRFGTIVAIRQMKPLDETGVSSDKAARFAIELNAGMAQKSRIQEGDKVVLPGYTDGQ